MIRGCVILWVFSQRLIVGLAAEKSDLRTYVNICEQRISRPACADAQAGQDLRCSPTQYWDLVEDIGLIAKILTPP